MSTTNKQIQKQKKYNIDWTPRKVFNKLSITNAHREQTNIIYLTREENIDNKTTLRLS